MGKYQNKTNPFDKVDAWQFTKQTKNNVYSIARSLQYNIYAAWATEDNPMIVIPRGDWYEELAVFFK